MCSKSEFIQIRKEKTKWNPVNLISFFSRVEDRVESELTVHLYMFCVLTSRESFLVLCFVTRTFRLASSTDSIRVGTLHSGIEVEGEIRE